MSASFAAFASASTFALWKWVSRAWAHAPMSSPSSCAYPSSAGRSRPGAVCPANSLSCIRQNPWFPFWRKASYISKKARVLSRDYASEFSLDLTLQDTELAVDLQRDVGLEVAAFAEIRRELEEAVREGLGEQDLFALEKHFLAR
jgi:NADP-dependent 3-hydroxyisobutyrate dehydrogenase-like protein